MCDSAEAKIIIAQPISLSWGHVGGRFIASNINGEDDVTLGAVSFGVPTPRRRNLAPCLVFGGIVYADALNDPCAIP